MTDLERHIETAEDEGFRLTESPGCGFTFAPRGRHRWEFYVETVPGVGEVRGCRCGVRRIELASGAARTVYRYREAPEPDEGWNS